ncbi:hypothetical protein FSP39_008932 [Pinctada imbricata]|uniref:Peptidase S1 domain-containing protein n=1 Tax=Pinctada imbricata TaxID=66713 RepID=A0AA88XR21_PINIB|nr:hypothetical protein FSP39_008932 [Pinctada imbricata]
MIASLFEAAADDDHSHNNRCGHPAIHPKETRIVGGHEARPGSLPWMVMLKELGEQVCGGSIISDTVILTAAHCFEHPASLDTKRWVVYAGKHHVHITDPMETKHYVSRIIIHEAYNKDTVANDIALLILQNRILYNRYVSPICLPFMNLFTHLGYAIGISAGWGDTRNTGTADVLNQVTLQVQSDNTCSHVDWYGHEFIKNTTFCAGYAAGGKDSCLGDSGGPFVIKVGGLWFQAGIISWGYDCARPRWPGIYTDVSRYMTWVVSHTSGMSNYFYNIYHDYKTAGLETLQDCKEKPVKATVYIGSLLTLFTLYKTNPRESDYEEALIEGTNEMLLIGKDIRNPNTDKYLFSILDAKRDRRLRYTSLLFFSIVYFDTCSSDAKIFEGTCKLVKPHWTEFHRHIADVGVFNRFIYLNKAMIDYDVNTDEWTEDGKPRIPVKISQLIKQY